MAKWFYFGAFLLNVLSFLLNYFEDDISGMVLNGFSAMLWFTLADREGRR